MLQNYFDLRTRERKVGGLNRATVVAVSINHAPCSPLHQSLVSPALKGYFSKKQKVK